MQIYSAARLEKDYSAVAAQCARTGEAQILAENGRADLVVMDAKTYQRLAEKATGTGSPPTASPSKWAWLLRADSPHAILNQAFLQSKVPDGDAPPPGTFFMSARDVCELSSRST